MAIEYSSDLALSAMMNVFGTIQTVIVAVLTVRDPSLWKINTDSLELIAILYGVMLHIYHFYLYMIVLLLGGVQIVGLLKIKLKLSNQNFIRFPKI